MTDVGQSDEGSGSAEITVETRFDARYMRPLEELTVDDLVRLGMSVYKRALEVKADHDD